jgi:ComF family protein
MFLLDLIFPSRCVTCHHILPTKKTLCDICRATIKVHSTFFCGSCRARLPVSTLGSSLHVLRSPCHPSFPYLLGAATDYDGVTKELVHALKFRGIRDAAQELGGLIIGYGERVSLSFPEIVCVPIPLSRRRLYERGYNQAELIANVLGDAFHAPVLRALRRVRNTPPQSQIKGHKQRISNVLGSFTVVSGFVFPRTVLLIDDVTTSGATLHEAALVLKAHGVRRVIALVAAKA